MAKQSGPPGKSGSGDQGQGPDKKKPGNQNPKNTPAGKKPPAKGNSGPSAAKGRQSVAAARQTKAGSNRTQLIIGGVAVALIVVVVVVGIVLNRKQTATPEAGYGASTASVATVQDGVVTITPAAGTAGDEIEIFADAMCPICGEFEHQFGQQIAKSVDDGALSVKIHMLNFLNKQSASGDYSTRAAAAFLAVANGAGDVNGATMNFYSALFAEGTQPKEGGSSDLTNEQLGDLAVANGAPQSVKADIVAGTYIDQATASAEASSAALQAATGRVATPTVLHDGQPVAVNNVNWLTELLAG